MRRVSERAPAAVDNERCAGDEGSTIGSEEENGVGDLRGRGEPPHWRPADVQRFVDPPDAIAELTISVRVTPGATAFTRTPRSAHSIASTFVVISTAAFAAQYASR